MTNSPYQEGREARARNQFVLNECFAFPVINNEHCSRFDFDRMYAAHAERTYEHHRGWLDKHYELADEASG